MLRVLAPVVLTVAVLAPVRATAAAPTCQGQEATIVGEPGRHVEGTDGPDVIVTAGAGEVRARGGADLVCITGAPALVETGDDDDVVRMRAPSHDVVIGSQDGDVVWSGSLHHPNDDQVLLQDSSHTKVVLAGKPTGEVRGGDGPGDVVVFNSDARVHWSLDNRTGTLTVGSADPVVLEGFEDVDLSLVPWTGLSFAGSPADETLAFSVTTYAPGRLVGGAGHDALEISSLVHGRDPVGSVDLTLHGFEDATVERLAEATVTGNAAPNHIAITACRGTAYGRHGADVLEGHALRHCSGPGVGVTADGGAGHDTCLADRRRHCEA